MKLGGIVAATLLLASCEFSPSTLAGADDADPNAPDADPNAPDADPNTPDGAPADAFVCTPWSYDPAHVDPCSLAQPSGPLTLTAASAYTYNTDSGILTGPGVVSPVSLVLTAPDPDVRVIVVDSLLLPADSSLRVIGGMPLLVVSWDDIDIQGRISVSSRLGGTSGAGANPLTCGNSTGGNGGNGSGGGGGGLGDDGGDGGTQAGAKGTKGAKISTPDNIRGGCGGGNGGGGAGTIPGVGGAGGGALYLAAQNEISISGVLHAGGSGGQGAQIATGVRSGGGGGGSGGYLGLEAPMVTLTASAVLAANGGAGGGGNDFNQNAGNGDNGPPADGPAAMHGIGVENGGDGGDGGILGVLSGRVGESVGDRGAGGGGGGVGFIIVNSANPMIHADATLSPDETVVAP